ncbi:MAG: hypothetical protein H7249_14270 [Chitinophagaceae bacterium]|nr:hypothetical protein [Oligoflexus sp.]
MLRKTQTLRLVAILWGLSVSCTTSSPLVKPINSPKVQVETVTDKTLFAVLVKDGEAKKWPHLTRHIGQLLLANSDTQVLLPAAPPLSTGQTFFALTSKVYQRHDKEWLEIPWLPTLEIHLAAKNGEPLQLIGQDIVGDKGEVSIHAFFRAAAMGAADARLIITLMPDQSRVDVKVIGSNGNVPWGLRIGRGVAEDFPIPIKRDQVAGLTSSLLPHAVSIIGNMPFSAKQDDRFTYLEAAPLGSGFKMLLARDSLMKQADLLQSLLPCYSTSEKSPAGLCSPGKLPTHTFKLTAPPPKPGEDRQWQNIFLYTNKGSFRSLIPIREGETLELPLSSKHMEVLYADSEGVLQKKEIPETGGLWLPSLKKAWLHVAMSDSTARYVELRNAGQTKGKSLDAWTNDKILLSPNTLLQTTWPLDMSLPSGDYHIRIYDGYQIACDQRFALLAGRKTALECPKVKNDPRFSARASISVDRAAIPDSLIVASGLRVLTSSEKSAHTSLVEVPTLAVYDSVLGLSMRAFPATDALEKTWTTAVTDRPERATLHHFSEFVRGHDKDIKLVLDCPPPGFQIAEYKWIVQNIRPDVLEVFGCQQPELSDELLRVANALQSQQDKPVRLAAASFSGSLTGSRVPALYLPRFKKESKIDTKMAIDDLKEGRYTLGFRTELVVPPVRMNDAQVKILVRSTDLNHQDVIVRVYDQDEKLNEEHFTLGEGVETDLNVSLRLKRASRFLRIELLGRDKIGSEAGPLFTLATSNFFGLDGT